MTRRAIVTGVAGGIGSAIVHRLSDAGWSVLGTDLEEPAELPLERFEPADLRDGEAVTATVRTLLEGRQLHVLVNNAAVQIVSSVETTTTADWDRTFDVNVRAPFIAMRTAASALRRGPGSVVNVASVHAIATSTGLAAYASSKGALTALTRAAAIEFAEHGVRVNAVLPGAVDTAMLQHGLERADDSIERAEQNLRELVPLGRISDPSEIAEAVLFLADPERSSYITGQSIVTDGGAIARLSTEVNRDPQR